MPPQPAPDAPLVLVVEDDPTINQALADRLRADGLRVQQVHDGPAAVQACEATPPDLVLLDVMLPGMDGLEVCRRIQARRPVPVLMLTARAEETDVLVGLGVGADDYLTKPFRMREVVARVRALLRRVDRARALAVDPPPVLRCGDLLVDRAERRVLRGWADARGTRTLDSHVKALRAKIGAERLRTVHGVGYALEAQDAR